MSPSIMQLTCVLGAPRKLGLVGASLPNLGQGVMEGDHFHSAVVAIL